MDNLKEARVAEQLRNVARALVEMARHMPEGSRR
jgi:hypothetical protein